MMHALRWLRTRVRMLYVYALLAREQFDRVPLAIASIIAEHPSYGPAFQIRGYAFHRLGRYEEALRDYGLAVEYGQRDADTYCLRGEVLRALNQKETALRDFDKAIELNPHLGKAYYERGCLKVESGADYDGAIGDLTEAIANDPAMAMAFVVRSKCWLMKGDQGKAESDAERAISIDSGLAAAFNSSAMAKDEKGDLDGAIDDYSTALQLDPNNPYYLIGRSTAYGRKGRLDHSLADSKRAVEVAPHNAVVHLNMGYTLSYLERYSDCVKSFEAAYCLDNDNRWDALFEASWTLSTCPDPQARNGERAMACAEKLAQMPAVPQATKFIALAAAAAESGDFHKAVAFQERAIDCMVESNKERYNKERAKEVLSLYHAQRAYHVKPISTYGIRHV